MIMFVFFFNDTATTEIYTLSLHDALPISTTIERGGWVQRDPVTGAELFPRTDPAVIMLVHDGGDRCVLRSEEHTSELQSRQYLVCRLLLEKKKIQPNSTRISHLPTTTPTP